MKIELITQENVKLTINQYDALRKQLQAKNKLSKFLGVCRSKPFCCKWKAAESNEISIKSAGWQTLITKIQLRGKRHSKTFLVLLYYTRENVL